MRRHSAPSHLLSKSDHDPDIGGAREAEAMALAAEQEALKEDPDHQATLKTNDIYEQLKSGTLGGHLKPDPRTDLLESMIADPFFAMGRDGRLSINPSNQNRKRQIL